LFEVISNPNIRIHHDRIRVIFHLSLLLILMVDKVEELK